MRRAAAWHLTGRPVSTLSIFTYLLAVWKAATVCGPSFPNRGSSDSCQQWLRGTWLAFLCTSQERNMSWTSIVGHHVYNTCNTDLDFKRPQLEKRGGCKLPNMVELSQKQALEMQNLTASTASHTNPRAVQPMLAFCLEGEEKWSEMRRPWRGSQKVSGPHRW